MSAEKTGDASPASAITYKTHFLIAFLAEAQLLIGQWDRVPTREEVTAARKQFLSYEFERYALCTPVGFFDPSECV